MATAPRPPRKTRSTSSSTPDRWTRAPIKTSRSVSLSRPYIISGNLVDWWEGATKASYLDKAKCIIKQYGDYKIERLGLSLNGINTQGENIADNGGIKEAYRAYSKN